MFIKCDYDVWDKEDIEDLIFNALYALNSEVFTLHPLSRIYTFRDNLVCKTIGCYFPPKDRIFYRNCIDVKNDGLPIAASFSGLGKYFDLDSDARNGTPPTLTTIVIFPIKNPPPEVRVPKCDQLYKVIHWEFFENGVERDFFKYALLHEDSCKNSNMIVGCNYVGVVRKDDRIIPVFDKRSYVKGAVYTNRGWIRDIFSMCASSYADSKYLWNVDCYYPIFENMNVWIKFGVYEEHIKSLFYARDLPLTSTGRKRPIQHWVKAHKRRIKKGTDVTNVKRHLRGINRFEMSGYKFLITNPRREIILPELEKRKEDIIMAIKSPTYSNMKQLRESMI